MNQLIDDLFYSLSASGVDPRIIIMVIALLPIAEARIAIPIALKCGLSPLQAFFYGFLGSSIIVPLLLVALIPLFRFLASTSFFGRIGNALLSRVEVKASRMEKRSFVRRFLSVSAFVAIPLPLTGVWTGSAVACVLEMGFLRSLAAVTIGNLIASALVLIISVAFSEYINIIMAVFAFVSLVTALSMLIRSLRQKKSA